MKPSIIVGVLFFMLASISGTLIAAEVAAEDAYKYCGIAGYGSAEGDMFIASLAQQYSKTLHAHDISFGPNSNPQCNEAYSRGRGAVALLATKKNAGLLKASELDEQSKGALLIFLDYKIFKTTIEVTLLQNAGFR